MKQVYALEWLNHVITQELDPDQTIHQPISPEKIEQIRTRIEQEEENLLTGLKQRVFRLHEETESRALVKKYHDALLLMISKNYDYQLHPDKVQTQYPELYNFIGTRLNRTLSLFENELSAFLGPENRVPLTKLVEQKSYIQSTISSMKKRLSSGDHGLAPVDIVMEVVNEFIDKIDNRQPVTLRESNYILELVNDVLNLDGNLTSITGCAALNELLIYWNLNSKTCIRYFTQGTERLMAQYDTVQAKLEFLKLEQKKLDNIPEKHDFVLAPDFPSVKTYCQKWLKNEINYRENQLEGFVPLAQQAAAEKLKENRFKIVVQLSADQIALILRAADATRTILARSLSAVFRAIAPYLSTPYNTDLNWDNLRTKSYAAEHQDKQATKDTLRLIIEKIDEF